MAPPCQPEAQASWATIATWTDARLRVCSFLKQEEEQERSKTEWEGGGWGKTKIDQEEGEKKDIHFEEGKEEDIHPQKQVIEPQL